MGKEDYKNEKKGHGFLCVPKELLLPGLIDEDSDIVKKAAQMICDAKKKYL